MAIARASQPAADAAELNPPADLCHLSRARPCRAVCTDPEYRGQGLATRLTLAVTAAIRARGDAPFLHVMATNVTAIRLYKSLGFRFRRTAPFVVARAPG